MMLSKFVRNVVFGTAMMAFVPAAMGASAKSFMPDNDLWMQDSLEVAPNITAEQFNMVIDAALAVYNPIAKASKETINVNRLWDNSTVNANVRREVSLGVVTINMFGGLARRPEVIVEGFALVLCHELGHAYGGAPYILASSRMGAEGVADYHGAGDCLSRVLPLIPPSFDVASITGYNAEKCAQNNPNDDVGYGVCVRSLEAGLSLGHLLGTLMNEKEASYLTPDPLVVTKTELSYPKTVQCRVDTYHNAIFKLPKPSCWFKQESLTP